MVKELIEIYLPNRSRQNILTRPTCLAPIVLPPRMHKDRYVQPRRGHGNESLTLSSVHHTHQIVQAGGGAYSGRIPTRPRTPVILEAQKHVRARLEKKWLVTFLATDEFKTRNSESDSYVEEEMSLAPEKKNKESVVVSST